MKSKKNRESYLKEAREKIENFRTKKLFESLSKLGFTFKNQDEVNKFQAERIYIGHTEDGSRMIFLDYEKPTEVLLAFHNNNPEEVNGKIAFRDRYYEGPDTQQPEGETKIVNFDN